ncbi:MAG TPA: hypothetical protein VGK74_02580 [Symbiobacteriaceae bacterium]|jgi:hypothetical protein
MKKAEHVAAIRELCQKHAATVAAVKAACEAERAELQAVIDNYATALDRQDALIAHLEELLKANGIAITYPA